MDTFYDDFRAIEDREIPQSEKVHLQKSESLEWSGGELCHDRVWIFRWWLERAKVYHRLWSDDHSTSMDSELTYSTLHLQGSIYDFFIFFI